MQPRKNFRFLPAAVSAYDAVIGEVNRQPRLV